MRLTFHKSNMAIANNEAVVRRALIASIPARLSGDGAGTENPSPSFYPGRCWAAYFITWILEITFLASNE